MSRFGVFILSSLALFCGASNAQVRIPVQTSGAVVVIPAFSEVRQANDEAHVTFMIEEQDKDKAAAASRVNQKMKQGTDILKREDPQAMLKTRGYYTYPSYPEDQPRPGTKGRSSAGWRVGQYLEMTTTNLDGLSKTVAAVQRVLALNGLQFGLTEATVKKLDEKHIDAAYRNLTDRIAAIAKAMGRSASDAIIETVDFEGAGVYAQQESPAAKMAMRAPAGIEQAPVEEPSFEPGETTLQLRVVGRVKFK